MNWLFGIKYRVWVISTFEEAELYLWKHLKHMLPNLNSIVELTDEEAYIRTFQSYEFENKWLGFGRMKWNEQNNKKWTQKYRTKELENRKLNFTSTEIWSPDWSACVKNGKSPKLYINLYHNENVKFSKEGILIAIQKRLAEANKEIIEQNILQLKDKIEYSKVSEIERKWTPTKGYVNRIENMNPHELEKLIKEGS